MSPRTVRLLLAGLAVLPHLGCLTASSGSAQSTTTPAALTGSGEPHKEVELPKAERAKVQMKLAQDMEQNGFPIQAIQYYEEARRENPRLKKIARRLAVLYDKLDEPKRALEEYQLALEQTPRDPNLLNDVGYYYYGRGQWDKAADYLRQALKIDPKHKRAWNNLGLTLGQQGRYDESLQAFQQVMSEAEAHSNLAFVFVTQQKSEQAKQEYRKALALDPGQRVARTVLDRLEHPKPAAKGKGRSGPEDQKVDDLARRAADVATEPLTTAQADRATAAGEQQAHAEKAAPAAENSGISKDLERLLAGLKEGPARSGARVAEALPTPPSPPESKGAEK